MGLAAHSDFFVGHPENPVEKRPQGLPFLNQRANPVCTPPNLPHVTSYVLGA